MFHRIGQPLKGLHYIMTIALKSKNTNTYFYGQKSNNSGPVLLQITRYKYTVVYKCMGEEP